MNAESELEAVGMVWGAAATGGQGGDRFDGPRFIADARVAGRDDPGPGPAGRAQHGPRYKATTTSPLEEEVTATTGTWYWRRLTFPKP